jgi:uncharacterized membrane protein YjjB (DUF3815 family)
VLEVVGRIPMIPGGFATDDILGLFAVTAQHPAAANQTLVTAVENSLRVAFTIGALGAGLAIPTLLLGVRVRSRRGDPKAPLIVSRRSRVEKGKSWLS